jgi:glutathione S-transferase
LDTRHLWTDGINAEQKALTMGIVLYELAGADSNLRFSPHCWKTRMALAHKGLQADRQPWRFTDKDAIAFSGQGRVPVLVDDGAAICDSWQIAVYLEERYPLTAALFPGEGIVTLSHFVNAWTDRTLLPIIARIILLDIYNCLAPGDRSYFRTTREERFGKSLEEVAAGRSANLEALGQALAPLRDILTTRRYVSGQTAAYADYCIFGMFMWSRCTSPIELLASDDPIFLWRERLLDAFGGLGRAAPSAKLQG